MVIEDKGEEEQAGGEDVVGTAFRDQMTSADGFTRGAGGRVKFNKDTKKRRRENAEEDVDMEDVGAAAKERPGKRRSEVKLGHEFKAKVSVLWFVCGPKCGDLNACGRKREAMSKRAAWTHMRTSRSNRRQKRATGAVASAWRVSGDRRLRALFSPFRCMYLSKSHFAMLSPDCMTTFTIIGAVLVMAR
jgi:hypothetical protein